MLPGAKPTLFPSYQFAVAQSPKWINFGKEFYYHRIAKSLNLTRHNSAYERCPFKQLDQIH
jgi:hypothetical protein